MINTCVLLTFRVLQAHKKWSKKEKFNILLPNYIDLNILTGWYGLVVMKFPGTQCAQKDIINRTAWINHIWYGRRWPVCWSAMVYSMKNKKVIESMSQIVRVNNAFNLNSCVCVCCKSNLKIWKSAQVISKCIRVANQTSTERQQKSVTKY